MKLGVTGATGQLGQLVVEQLKKRVASEDVIALVRTPEKAKSLGVEAREFDYAKPELLAAQLDGIDYLLLISGNEIGQRAIQHSNVIEAAKKAGIKWIVYTSLLHAEESSLSLAGEHLATEKALKESGLEYTVLRNGWYSENYTGSIPGSVEAGAFVGSAGDGKISSAARVDYAEAAAVVLSDDSHKGKVYELSGDNAYTLTELAEEISKQTGKTIPYSNMPEAEYSKVLKSIGIPEGFADAIAGWDVGASKNDLYDEGKQLSELIGRPTTPISESVKQVL
ncbi:SDR family oxidoreductase [Carboxylicivirga linearis]|uniref:SDR family oxidoreductase n=1 Tax=Carboxylicivirga linearis TaxID=1628157 RepID=A0ABS5JYW4_9BACT|nr:SDR family oxidoreductase [Carboxylicivirga linearis]MBS2100056.1 SDR family oxidoreductase [Carboxylicivirga linearis]